MGVGVEQMDPNGPITISNLSIGSWAQRSDVLLVGDEIVEQALVLHTIDSNEEPSQLLPPFDGAGLEQALDLDFCPVSHVLVQLDM